MKLRLSDPDLIDSFQEQITEIGNSVQDPSLFKRIYKACREKQAFLFVSREGFIVLKPMSGKQLLVWVAFSHTRTNRLSYMFEIEQFARDIEAVSIVFWSNRPGFNRIAPRFGFTSIQSEWMGLPITVWSKKLFY